MVIKYIIWGPRTTKYETNGIEWDVNESCIRNEHGVVYAVACALSGKREVEMRIRLTNTLDTYNTEMFQSMELAYDNLIDVLKLSR